MAELCVELDAVEVRFSNVRALQGISFAAKSGDQVLLLGRNGSGKSTLLRVCAGLQRPSKGIFKIGNQQTKNYPYNEIGYLTHMSMLYGQLSVEENLKLFSTLYGVQEPISAALEMWELGSIKSRRVAELSKGMVARVSLCRAFLNKPKIVFLDEPTSALDDQATELLLNNLKQQKNITQDFCVIVATHDIARFSSFANRAVLLDEGCVVQDSTDISRVVDAYRKGNR